MLILGLNETIDQLVTTSSVHWYHMLSLEDGHVLKKALEFKVEGQKKKWRSWIKIEIEYMKVGLCREDALQ